jgi:16S rRNA (uracil1498-N3)-methyltransferase
MPKVDFRSPRLFVDAALHHGAAVALDRNQSNYLGNVLRLQDGATILVFNGRDGEWRASLSGRKRAESLVIIEQVRVQDSLPPITLAFAPLKHARLDYAIQKAVEMGVSCLQPVMTRFTQASRVNSERMRANAIEAAEQCGILSISNVADPLPLERWLGTRDPDRLLVFCDEEAPVADPVRALAAAPRAAGTDLVIGPEGGFADEERRVLMRQPLTLVLALGPRILRADTAAVAALALVQAVRGDWAGAARIDQEH